MSAGISLVLSSVSSTVRWAAFDIDTGHLLDSRSWNDDQSRALSDSLGRELGMMKINMSHVKAVCVLTGPGAFTGLRMGVAFALGLARGLGVSLIGIPTWDLFEEPFYIPTRHQLAKKLSLAECLEQSLEFMHVKGAHEVDLSPPAAKALVMGVSTTHDWPQVQVLVDAAKRRLQKGLGAQDMQVQIFYGMEPKISGQR